jgi:hypothetical protein
MHQSRMLVSQALYVLVQLRGVMRVRLSRTALRARSASGFIRTYHCLDTKGSTTVLHR